MITIYKLESKLLKLVFVYSEEKCKRKFRGSDGRVILVFSMILVLIILVFSIGNFLVTMIKLFFAKFFSLEHQNLVIFGIFGYLVLVILGIFDSLIFGLLFLVFQFF